MVDNQENILVEFDYNNILVIDPNKVIDENGRAKERLVKQENLVIYANLECNVIPRTKLALGVASNDAIQTVSVAKINFLNPGGKTYLENTYTDEITGKDAIKGQGVNQPTQKSVSNPNKTDDYYIRQTLSSGGNPGATDNGLLGITQIKISVNTAFNPTIEIEMEDVKGRALFEGGDSSPYAAFFNMPYPLFNLTIKGFYGKAVKMPLMLMDFQSRYDSNSGNFKVTTKFYTYKFSILAEISMGYLVATPHMYQSRVGIQERTGGPNKTTNVKEEIVEIGYQKIREMYSEYKSKGIIPNDFPEITLVQMEKRIENFIKNVLDDFTKQNVDPLNDCEDFQKSLNDFRGDVYTFKGDSWFEKYCDTKNFFTTKSGLKIYTFKPELSLSKQSEAKTELDSLIKKYNKKFNENNTFKEGGFYTLKGSNKSGEKKLSTEIKCPITGIKNLIYSDLQKDDIDWKETYRREKGNNTPNDGQIADLIRDFIKRGVLSQGYPLTGGFSNGSSFQNNTGNLFYFEGSGSFIEKLDQMNKQLKLNREKIENDLTDALQILLENPTSGIGFVPNLRNVLAVIFASGEAFIRLMEDVHKKAWDKCNEKDRKKAIFSLNTSNANTDNIDSGFNENNPVYPWPQFIVQTTGDDKQEKYEIAYPGNPKYIDRTKAFLYDVWPEVEFVEEFIKGYSERLSPPSDTSSYGNESTDVRRISYNAIEFPSKNIIFENKEQVKFFYEIWERLFIYSFYSKLSRTTSTSNSDKLYNLISEAEKNNIIQSLGSDNPLLIQKIKQYNFNGSNIEAVLRQFSNDGTGQSWQNFIRGIFNTSYIKNYVENSSYEILNQSQLNNENTLQQLSTVSEKDLDEYLKNPTNSYDFTDLYPFTNSSWCKTNLGGGGVTPNFFETSKVLLLNKTIKNIANFTESTQTTQVRPVTCFNYTYDLVPATTFATDLIIRDFYSERLRSIDQLPTEGNLNYFDYSGNVSPNQTVSMLNTPYFINSISDGVQKFREFDPHPFVSSAYLFINSLPLSTLREKFKTQDSPGGVTNFEPTNLNYIFSTLKKFGAIHKLPYAWILKIGSVYHRYKNFIETGNDILNNSWSGISYVNSFDPVSNSPNKTYFLTINNSNVDITLESNNTVGSEISTLMNVGFYPKILNDFNVFYQGSNVINPTQVISGTCYVVDTTLTVQTINTNNLIVGSILFGQNIQPNTTIVSQIDGTPGGPGNYEVDISQNVVQNSQFNVSNSTLPGYTDQDVQDSLNKNLVLNYVDKSKISLAEGFDPSKPTRDLRIIPWSIFVKTPDNKNSFIMPSCGFLTNQTLYECFRNDTTGYTLTNEVTGNTSIHNGSVRLFWAAPNYGFFDDSRITKPTPYEYMKTIFSGETQENFSINGNNKKYTSIDEIFSVFEKGILDKFEEMFLSFSKSIYDYDGAVLSGETTPTQATFLNFQMLFRTIMNIPIQTGTTGEDVVKNIISEQSDNLRTTIKLFMEYDVFFKYGNPSGFDRKLFGSFTSDKVTDPITWDFYKVTTPNALPPSPGVTVVSSKLNYPDEWKALETHVGFSNLSGLSYTNNGSYITDFFIDNNIAFNVTNIVNLAPIIKIYATQKSLGKISGSTSFTTLIDQYINSVDQFQINVTNNLFQKLQRELPEITTSSQNKKIDVLKGDQNHVELWETFKALNDRWIAGTDFNNVTLLEDVLLLDRASRNIGEKVLIDIFKLRDVLMNIPEKVSMLSFVQTILMENNFVVMNIPSYINFYGVQQAAKDPKPRPEGTLELANNLFGTHMNVDYRDTSTKMVCFYAGKPSEHLDIKNVDYRFRSDAFDLRRSSDNPLVENQSNKNDWDKSNKVVGFNVDIGPQKQSIFSTFFVDQRAGTPTAEGLQVINDMASLGGNRNTSTQNLSLYNLYKNRSYNCTVSMLGNAMIQPTMYFNLRYVPMFSGPYMILSVNHVITPGGFETTFTGVRQPIPNLPLPDNFLQSLKKTLLETIKTKDKQEKDTINSRTSQNQNNVLNQTKTSVTGLDDSDVNSKSNSDGCTASTVYSKYVSDTPTTTTINRNNLATIIKNSTSDQKLRYVIFSKIYLTTRNGAQFTTKENNFAAIALDINVNGGPMNWGGLNDKYFTKKKYYCSSNQIPYAFFNSPEDSVKFLVDRWGKRMSDVSIDSESITKFLFLNQTSVKADDNVYTGANSTDLNNIRFRVEEAINIWNSIV